MPGISVRLGYYPLCCSIQSGEISFFDLSDREENVSVVEGYETVHKNWIYAPKNQTRNFFTGQIVTQPFNRRVFSLPKTHILTHHNADSLFHLEFLTWCLGFFAGMRLTTTEAGFLDATPIKPGALNDFVLGNREHADALALSQSFWELNANNLSETKAVTGIIHALFLSQYPHYLKFEEFNYLYIALDACYALTKSLVGSTRRLLHAGRIEWMCQQFEMPTPEWAKLVTEYATPISLVRNPTLHEALFNDEPLGFSVLSEENIPINLEMRALVCRLLVALLGAPNCSYVKSPVNTRQTCGLDLDHAVDTPPRIP